jgi:cellulose synthase/poly-beta-1,6-N-acetylglucosamine synthase-like glycosyltransferase
MDDAVAALVDRLREISPRWTRPVTPWPSAAIHGAVLALWAGLFAYAFFGAGVGGWAVGLIYIFYDTLLLAFTAWQTWPLRRAIHAPGPSGARPSLAVIVAAYNEAAVLAGAINGLARQDDPPDEIVIADDGSTDATAALLQGQFGLEMPAIGAMSAPSTQVKGLRWLRAPHGGKAQALNRAMLLLESELFVTVDADTALAPDAVGAMRQAFAARPGLVAATGVLAPVCGKGLEGRVFEWFQTYEYVRNFLSRYAWGRVDGLLLISGAFAGFRRAAVLAVGGFDPDCLVEDYELIHRLRRYGYDQGLDWHSAVLGNAQARTLAPDRLMGFLRQRRRWFGGFLQTQFWYRDMAGAGKYGAVGKWMLPVKAVDTMQPVYGICAFGLLLFYILSGHWRVLVPVGGFILAKIILDLGFHLWSVHLYRRWVGGHKKIGFFYALLAAVVEPFGFQLLRHLGACWGWVAFLTGRKGWR